MSFLNEWLIFSLILLGIWLIVFILTKNKKEIFYVSLLTMPFGLTEPIFVPEYWNPPSLFNLAAKTGFDIESLIFCFAVGGIVSVIYELFFKVKHKRMSGLEINHRRHKFHSLILISFPIIFLALYFFSNFNPIYSTIFSMLIFSVLTLLCRPDLNKKILLSGILFLIVYFVFFLFFNLFYPYAVEKFWNLSALSGILIFGIPLEELIFAFSFGLAWGSIYEYIKWYKLKEVK